MLESLPLRVFFNPVEVNRRALGNRQRNNLRDGIGVEGLHSLCQVYKRGLLCLDDQEPFLLLVALVRPQKTPHTSAPIAYSEFMRIFWDASMSLSFFFSTFDPGSYSFPRRWRVFSLRIIKNPARSFLKLRLDFPACLSAKTMGISAIEKPRRYALKSSS